MRKQAKQHGLKLLCLATMGALSHSVYAADCSDLSAWQQGQAYTGGQQVQYQGAAYEANWWTQTNPAEASGQWQDWTLLGDCDSAVTNASPQVDALTPVSGSSFVENDSVIISAQASDSDGTIAAVEFYVDEQLLGTDTSSPFTLTWQAVLGEHQVSAVAVDDQGAGSERVTNTISVSAKVVEENAAPMASIQLTPNSTEVVIGQSVDLTLTGSDSDGSISSLELKLGDTSVVSTSDGTAQYTWQPDQIGQYTFTLTVTDDEGATGQATQILNVVAEQPPVSEHSACKPEGLYQTPGVNTPYCTIYDQQGREKMGADHPRRIIGYFTSWRNGANDQPSYLVNDIPWDKITHINYAFAHVSQDNKVSIGDPNAEGNPATNMQWPQVTDAQMDPEFSYSGHFNLLNKFKKQHPDVKTLISVGGWAETGGFFGSDGERVDSGGFYTMTTNSDGSINHQGIATFAQSAVEFIRSYGFDGVDIDYEYPSSMKDSGHPDDFAISNSLRASLNASYVELMKVLREELDKAGEQDGVHYLLTIASPSSGYLLRGMETFQAVKYLDYVNIMSYDLHGAWNSHVGHNAPLFDTGKDSELAQWDVYSTPEYEGIGYLNTDWAVRYFRGALAAGRINIGLPYYTRGFRDVDGGTNGLWGQAALPDQSNCPKGTGIGEQNKCGHGAIGIDNLWHDKNDQGFEMPAGSNPLWHAKNLENGIYPSYAATYGLTPDTDEDDQLQGAYTRYYDDVAVAPWLWNEQKSVFISIEDEQSMAEKLQYVIDQGIGGIMFWELAGDYAYDSAKGEYFMGSTLTTLAYNTFNQDGSEYSMVRGNPDFVVPEQAVDISFKVKDFPVGDENYPIAPTFEFTNNSDLDLTGATISFDVPVSTSAIFRSNWDAQEKLGFNVEQNGSNASGNNIGGFDNEFHRFSITLVNEWGGADKAFAPGDVVNAQVMYYMPITGPANFTVEKNGTVLAFSSEYPQLPQASTTGEGGGSTGSGTSGASCEGIDTNSLNVYPDWPQTDWAGNPSHATGGDQMIHNDVVYEAKWWTTAEPGTSADWLELCNL